MPKVYLDRKEKKKDNLVEFITGRMKTLKLRQQDMADEIDITQPAFTNRLEKGYFTYEDLLSVFNKLEATDEEIVRLMRL